MEFNKDVLQLLAYGGFDDDDYEVIVNRLVGTRRWSTVHEMVFKYKEDFYQTNYSRGATEMQDEQPYEYDLDEIECQQVWPHTKVVTEYLPTKPRAKISLELTPTGDEYHAIN